MLDSETKESLFQKVIDLYRGDFCEDVLLDWCLIKRERLARMYLSVLGKLIPIIRASDV